MCFRIEFSRRLRNASYHEIGKMRKEILKVMRRRFVSGKSKGLKNASVEHGMTESELRHFLQFVDDGEFRTIFLLIAILGLRPNELVRLRGRDCIHGKLLIPASKGGYELDLRLPGALISLVPHVGPDERIFLGRFTPKHAKKVIGQRFRQYRAMAGMEEIYGWSEAGGRNGKQIRPLYRFSLKSFRYTGGQMVEALTGRRADAQRLWRHKNSSTSDIYARKGDKERLEDAVDFIFKRMENSEVLTWTSS